MNTPKGRELQRSLGLSAATMIVAGSMIGSGIFRKPATMAGQLLSPEWLIAVWIIAGIVTFIGALVNAEIAGIIDATGGQYVYFRKMYGEFTSYMYGWSILTVIQTGSQAAIAYVFAEYLGYFIKMPLAPEWLSNFSVYFPFVGAIHPFMEFGTKITAIAAILLLTGINYVGVVFGGVVQTVVTYVKIASIMLLGFLLLAFGHGSFANLVSAQSTVASSPAGNFIVLIGLALAGAFWAYDGWNNLTFVSGEVMKPQRNVPLGLLYGTLIVMVVYVFINIGYLYVLPIDVMKNSKLVAATACENLFGNAGGSIISIAVIISTFGALNGSILSTARVQFAMARARMFFEPLGRVHPRFATPHVSLLVQGVWSAVLVLSGTFDTITDYVIFAAWLFYMLGALGVIVLRYKMPNAIRPYKVWGYPFTPIIFVVFSFMFLLNSIISNTQNAMMGTMLIASGLPLYFYLQYRKKKMANTEE
ncbi:MAG: amino acid permease [Ignavibacteria bacterium]|nr:amino acid permease [Ignavibacteria bacterium]